MTFVRKPKIAILTQHPSLGGGVLSSLRIVYKFCQLYFHPKIFCLNFDPSLATSLSRGKLHASYKDTSVDGMPMREIGARWGFWESSNYFFTRDMWDTALEDYAYIFVVSGTPHVAHPAVLLGQPFILWLASTFYDDRRDRIAASSWRVKMFERIKKPFMERIERLILRRATVLMPISTYTYNLCQQAVGVLHRPFKICPVPIDLAACTATLPVKPYIISSVARFCDPRKNFPMLLSFAEQLLHDQRFAVEIGGQYPESCPEVARLKQLFGERIIFHGILSEEAKNALYQRSFVTVITSYQEGLCISGLESLAHGVPVVSTRCGGVADYVVKGQTGYLVDCDDVAAMLQSVKLLAEDQELYALLQVGARAMVARRYSTETVYNRFKDALSLAYPELKSHFARIDAEEDASEIVNSGTCVSSTHQ